MTTALMPLNPAVSPQQVARILPIRANLLPPEITDRRTARRVRLVVIGLVVTVVAGLGGWYASANQTENRAESDLEQVTAQVDDARAAQKRNGNAEVTAVIQNNKTYATDLGTLLADDLDWSTLLNDLRATGAAKGITISGINAAIPDKPAAGTPSFAGATAARTIATLTIAGTAKDKKTVAAFITALPGVTGVADPFLTTAAQGKSGVSFTINADVTAAARCGRFSATKCTTGGK